MDQPRPFRHVINVTCLFGGHVLYDEEWSYVLMILMMNEIAHESRVTFLTV